MQVATKTPLPFEKYEDYDIDHAYSAFIVEFQELSSEQADQIESDYVIQKYKIFHSELNVNSSGTYDLKIIVAQLSYTF